MPWTSGDLPFMLILPALLAGSAFFSGSETALFGLTAHERMQLTRRRNLVGTALSGLLADPRGLLVTLMLGNMIMNVGYFVVSSALLLRIDPQRANPAWYLAAGVGPLLAIILFGEVLPKLLANTGRSQWVRGTAVPMMILHRVAAPGGRVISRWIVEPVGRLVAGSRPAANLTTEELEAMLEMSGSRGVIGADEQSLLRQVVQLGRMKVRDVMTPRVDLLAVEAGGGMAALRELMARTPRSRYLLYDGDLDHILGVVFVRQVLLAERLGRDADPRRLAQNVRYVPEIMRVDQLLTEFRRTRTQLAVAVDEYGGTAGIVTLKDIVEQVVGELEMEEEWEIEAPDSGERIEQIDERAWRVSGRLSIHDWKQAFGAIELPARVSTVGGLVMALLGRAARVGDRVSVGNLILEVETAERGRIGDVVLRLAGSKPAAAPPDGESGGAR